MGKKYIPPGILTIILSEPSFVELGSPHPRKNYHQDNVFSSCRLKFGELLDKLSVRRAAIRDRYIGRFAVCRRRGGGQGGLWRGLYWAHSLWSVERSKWNCKCSDANEKNARRNLQQNRNNAGSEHCRTQNLHLKINCKQNYQRMQQQLNSKWSNANEMQLHPKTTLLYDIRVRVQMVGGFFPTWLESYLDHI